MLAKSQELEAAIAQLEKEIEENDQALRKADEMRQADLAEFNKNEKELLQSIQALGNAIVVLSKHHESFLQTSAHSVSSVSAVAKSLISLKKRAAQILAPEQMTQLNAFLSEDQPAGFKSYSSQSGQIFGIL